MNSQVFRIIPATFNTALYYIGRTDGLGLRKVFKLKKDNGFQKGKLG